MDSYPWHATWSKDMAPGTSRTGFEFGFATCSCVILGKWLQVSLATCYLKTGGKTVYPKGRNKEKAREPI